MSSDRVLGYHQHCTRCKGTKVDVIQTGYYYCATCWMHKYAKSTRGKRKINS